MGRSRSGFETLDAYIDATGLTVSVVVNINELHSGVDLLDQLALSVSCAQFQTEFFFLSGSIGWIREVGSFIFHMVYSAIHFLHQIALPIQQDRLKMHALLLIHVLFAPFRFVGLEIVELKAD